MVKVRINQKITLMEQLILTEEVQQILTEIQELRKAGEIKTMVQELEMELIRKEERIQVQLSHLQQEVNRLSHL